MQKIIKNGFLFSLIFVLSGFGSTASAMSYGLPGPIFSTDYATNVTYNSATLNAMVFGIMDLYTPNNGQSVYFEYGKSENALNMTSESSGPINSNFAKNVTNLEANTKYYYRVVVAFGPNSVPANHKEYAGVMNFTTLVVPTQNTTTTTTTTTNTTTNNSTNTNNTTTNTNTTPVTTTTNTPQQEVRCPAGYVFSTTTGARCTTFDNTTTTNTTNTNSTVESTLRYTSVIAMVKSVSTNLTLRSRGESVSKLQSFLIDQNKGVAARNLAESGATGYFGTLTRLALSEFQASVGITPASGYFGAMTRAYIANNF